MIFGKTTSKRPIMQLHVLHPSFCKLNRVIMPEENVPPEVKELKIKLQYCLDLRKKKVTWDQIKNMGLTPDFK